MSFEAIGALDALDTLDALSCVDWASEYVTLTTADALYVGVEAMEASGAVEAFIEALEEGGAADVGACM